MTSFILLDDPNSGIRRFIRGEEISDVEVSRGDGSVKITFTNAREIHLTQQEGKQFLAHVHPQHRGQPTGGTT